MSSREDLLSRYMRTLEHHTQKLCAQFEQEPAEQTLFTMTCLHELQNALEEMQVVEEELQQQNEELQRQNEELLATHQSLFLERQRYQDLFEFAPDGYIVTDIYGIVQTVNRAAAALLHIKKDHLIGKPLISFATEPQRQAFRSMLSRISQIQRVQEWEVRLRRPDSGEFDASLTIETVQDINTGVTNLRWLLRDITDRKHTEDQLRQMQLQNLELVESNRLKTQFIATMSHEFRTPMNVILGFSELLIRHLGQMQNAQLMGMAERIFRNGKHLMTILEEILDLAQLRQNRLQVQIEVFDLADLLHQTIDDLQPLAKQRLLQLQVTLPQREILLNSDRNRLRQVLINLITNGIKFTPVGSVSVTIVELPTDRVAIAVKDTGIGIAPDHQPLVFQEFWQADPATNRQYGGTGLGLSISKALIEHMQGCISLESAPGNGTTFYIELPRNLASEM